MKAKPLSQNQLTLQERIQKHPEIPSSMNVIKLSFSSCCCSRPSLHFITRVPLQPKSETFISKWLSKAQSHLQTDEMNIDVPPHARRVPPNWCQLSGDTSVRYEYWQEACLMVNKASTRAFGREWTDWGHYSMSSNREHNSNKETKNMSHGMGVMENIKRGNLKLQRIRRGFNHFEENIGNTLFNLYKKLLHCKRRHFQTLFPSIITIHIFVNVELEQACVLTVPEQQIYYHNTIL